MTKEQLMKMTDICYKCNKVQPYNTMKDINEIDFDIYCDKCYDEIIKDKKHMKQVRDICNSAPSRIVNSDYTHFVVNKITGKIVSGWEYRSDAIDSAIEFNQWYNGIDSYNALQGAYKVVKTSQHPVNPFDSANWSNS